MRLASEHFSSQKPQRALFDSISCSMSCLKSVDIENWTKIPSKLGKKGPEGVVLGALSRHLDIYQFIASS
jgi:hypothetical protein